MRNDRPMMMIVMMMIVIGDCDDDRQ